MYVLTLFGVRPSEDVCPTMKSTEEILSLGLVIDIILLFLGHDSYHPVSFGSFLSYLKILGLCQTNIAAFPVPRINMVKLFLIFFLVGP